VLWLFYMVCILHFVCFVICGACTCADDILITARTIPAHEAMCAEISREEGRVGLVINPDKTKYMRFSASPSRRSVKGATINGVN